eukprot:1569370-Pyramimonas_sp.AAC.1
MEPKVSPSRMMLLCFILAQLSMREGSMPSRLSWSIFSICSYVSQCCRRALSAELRQSVLVAS